MAMFGIKRPKVETKDIKRIETEDEETPKTQAAPTKQYNFLPDILI